MRSVSKIVQWAIGTAVSLAVLPAQAQSNLDAGKSPAQIFADTCSACHRSPRELRQTNAWFLREHYTTGTPEAMAMAAYLASVGSDPRAVQRRRPPDPGAGRATATEAAPRTSPAPDHAKNPETQAALPATTPGRQAPAGAEHSPPGSVPAATLKPRRPSQSVEAGRVPVDASQGGGAGAVPPQAAAAAPAWTNAFEE